MRDGEVIDGLTILREGLRLDEREHVYAGDGPDAIGAPVEEADEALFEALAEQDAREVRRERRAASAFSETFGDVLGRAPARGLVEAEATALVADVRDFGRLARGRFAEGCGSAALVGELRGLLAEAEVAAAEARPVSAIDAALGRATRVRGSRREVRRGEISERLGGGLLTSKEQ